MSSTSGVLIVGTPLNSHFDFGADYVKDFDEATRYIGTKHPSVVVFGDDSEGLESFCRGLAILTPQSLWILAGEGLSPAQLREWTNSGKLYDMVESFTDPELEQKLKSALEASGEVTQSTNLVKLFADQSRQLKRLTNDLEARVTRRHRDLRKSQRTLEQTKVRLESFHKALLGIHRAATVQQMEQTLNEALKESMDLLWVKVRFSSLSLLQEQVGEGVLAIDLPAGQNGVRGQVLLAKPPGAGFTPDEVDFLHELTEALDLALQRLDKLEQAQTFKAQWQATFDSIPHPLCLTNDEFEIVKLNAAFQEACAHRSFHSLLGKNCFEVFFGSAAHPPAVGESPFTFRHSRTGPQETEHFEVIGESLGMTHDGQAVQLILLRPITEEVRFERRIFEGSKLAELGTIGSSIAHELNNPLGGMLSFLQLILMDLKSTDEIYAEIKSMEQGVLRCRDIVLNLLSFARKHDLSDINKIDLLQVIDRSVKLIELQSKSMGIAIDLPPRTPALILGSQNALSQALCNLLQNAIDAINDRLAFDPLFHGKISLQIELTGEKCVLRVSDNGMGIRPEVQSKIFNPLFTTRDPSLFGGMGLTTAFTIISEHHGSLEILSQTGSGTTAILSLPRA